MPTTHCYVAAMVLAVHWFGHIFRNNLMESTFAMNRTHVSLIEAVENLLLSYVRMYLSFIRAIRLESCSLLSKNGVGSTPTLGSLVMA